MPNILQQLLDELNSGHLYLLHRLGSHSPRFLTTIVAVLPGIGMY